MKDIAELSHQAAAVNPVLTAATYQAGSAEALPPPAKPLGWVDPATIPAYSRTSSPEPGGWQKVRDETDLSGELPPNAFAPEKMNITPALMINPPGKEAGSGLSEAAFEAMVGGSKRLLPSPNQAANAALAQSGEKFPINLPYVSKSENTMALDAVTAVLKPWQGPDNRSATTLLPRLSARLAAMRERQAQRSKPFGYTPRHRKR
jgi:hypothetical protein